MINNSTNFDVIVGYSVYDYVHNLKRIPYPSEEYVQMRETVRTLETISDILIDQQTSSLKVALSELE
jgi:hypothetical protein